MRNAILIPLLAACGPTEGSGVPPADTTDSDTVVVTSGRPDDSTSAQVVSDEGSIILLRRRSPERDNAAYGYAVFLDDDPGFLNTAQCAIAPVPCIQVLPSEEGEAVSFDDGRMFDQANPTFRYLGTEITIGPYTLPYVFDEVDGRSYYAAILDDDPLVYGSYPVSIAGEWSGLLDDADPADDPMVLIDEDLDLVIPDYKFDVDFVNGEDLLFEWTPTGTGDIYLIVEALGISQLFWLEDDGYEAFDVGALGFDTDDLDVQFTMSRWTHTKSLVGPHELDAISVSEIVLIGHYIYVGDAEELIIVDTCSTAELLPPITESGLYYGKFGDWFGNDLSPGYGGCTGYLEGGEEGIVPVHLEPNTIMSLSYTVDEGDPAIYLLTDCDKAASCLVGADADVSLGGIEYLTYFNQTEEAQDLYLVLDGWYQGVGLGASLLERTFELDLTIDTLEEPEMYDDCLDAQLQTIAMPEGTYYTETFPYTGLINPGAGGCTQTSVPGPESITKVEIADGETLTATLSMTGGDGALYLMYNCVNPASCAVGSDTTTTGPEAVGYSNLSGAPATLFLVVDTKDVLGPYILTVDKEP